MEPYALNAMAYRQSMKAGQGTGNVP